MIVNCETVILCVRTSQKTPKTGSDAVAGHL